MNCPKCGSATVLVAIGLREWQCGSKIGKTWKYRSHACVELETRKSERFRSTVREWCLNLSWIGAAGVRMRKAYNQGREEGYHNGTIDGRSRWLR